MERESNMQALCRSGCGFYGNPSTEGMCSVCYKEAVKKKQQPPASSSPAAASLSTASTTVPAVSVTSTEPAELAESSRAEAEPAEVPSLSTATSSSSLCSSVVDTDSDAGIARDAKKKKNRCGACNKKVGLTGFECRCGGLFCSVHRYSDKHDCSFNYRELGAEEIRRNNPVVVGQKIQKI